MGNCQLTAAGKDLFMEATAGAEDGGAKDADPWQPRIPVMFADGKRISVSVQRRTQFSAAGVRDTTIGDVAIAAKQATQTYMDWDMNDIELYHQSSEDQLHRSRSLEGLQLNPFALFALPMALAFDDDVRQEEKVYREDPRCARPRQGERVVVWDRETTTCKRPGVITAVIRGLGNYGQRSFVLCDTAQISCTWDHIEREVPNPDPSVMALHARRKVQAAKARYYQSGQWHG